MASTFLCWKATCSSVRGRDDKSAPAPDTTGAVTANNTMADTTRRDYPDHGLVDMSKDQLKNAPEFKYNSQK